MKEESRLMRRMSLAEIRIRELEAELAALQEVYNHAMNELYPTVAAERDALREKVEILDHEIVESQDVAAFHINIVEAKCTKLRAERDEEREIALDLSRLNVDLDNRVVELEAAIQAALDRSHRARFSTGKEYVWMDIDTAERLRALIPERE